MKNKEKKEKKSKPISLYPLKPEEVLKDILKTPPKKKKKFTGVEDNKA